MPDPQPTQPTNEDFAALKSMLMADDAATRAQAVQIASKLTSDEHQAFSAYAERHREDTTMGGLPIESALVSGLGITRAAAGTGLSIAGRVTGAAREAVSQATPMVKYEATKQILMHIGVPEPAAIPIATIVSGLKRPARGGTTTAVAEAAPTAAPAPTAPSSSPTTPAAGPLPAAPTPSGPTPSPSPAPMTLAQAAQQAAKLKLSAAEYGQMRSWIAAGTPPDQALARLTATRSLQATGPFANLPTDLETVQAVAARNATGRWKP